MIGLPSDCFLYSSSSFIFRFPRKDYITFSMLKVRSAWRTMAIVQNFYQKESNGVSFSCTWFQICWPVASHIPVFLMVFGFLQRKPVTALTPITLMMIFLLFQFEKPCLFSIKSETLFHLAHAQHATGGGNVYVFHSDGCANFVFCVLCNLRVQLDFCRVPAFSTSFLGVSHPLRYLMMLVEFHPHHYFLFMAWEIKSNPMLWIGFCGGGCDVPPVP